MKRRCLGLVLAAGTCLSGLACPATTENPSFDAGDKQPCMESRECEAGLYCIDFHCRPPLPDASPEDWGYTTDSAEPDAAMPDAAAADTAAPDTAMPDAAVEDAAQLEDAASPEDAAPVEDAALPEDAAAEDA